MSALRVMVGFLLVSTAFGCSAAEPAAAGAKAVPEKPPTVAGEPKDLEAATEGEGGRKFGRAVSDDRPVTQLATIIGTPDKFDGELVKTEGTIQRVCQKMGCWMELRAESGQAVRVPMAGHAFFLPKDVAGRPATVEGRVGVQPLTDDVKDHLKAEGAAEHVLAQAVHIEASGVVIR